MGLGGARVNCQSTCNTHVGWQRPMISSSMHELCIHAMLTNGHPSLFEAIRPELWNNNMPITMMTNACKCDMFMQCVLDMYIMCIYASRLPFLSDYSLTMLLLLLLYLLLLLLILMSMLLALSVWWLSIAIIVGGIVVVVVVVVIVFSIVAAAVIAEVSTEATNTTAATAVSVATTGMTILFVECVRFRKKI